LHDICPKNEQNALILHDICRKNNFFFQINKKIFFWGGVARTPAPPISYTYEVVDAYHWLVVDLVIYRHIHPAGTISPTMVWIVYVKCIMVCV